jgi:hypothetical protein
MFPNVRTKILLGYDMIYIRDTDLEGKRCHGAAALKTKKAYQQQARCSDCCSDCCGVVISSAKYTHTQALLISLFEGALAQPLRVGIQF